MFGILCVEVFSCRGVEESQIRLALEICTIGFFGTTRNHCRAAFPTAQDRLHGTEVEPALSFRGVMTFRAMLLEQRFDMGTPQRIHCPVQPAAKAAQLEPPRNQTDPATYSAHTSFCFLLG
jgi:hypothetical protein